MGDIGSSFFNIFSVSHILDFQAERSKRPLVL